MYVTLDHKTSHKGQLFFNWDTYIILNIWLRYNYLKIWNLKVQKNLNTEKIAFNIGQNEVLGNSYY